MPPSRTCVDSSCVFGATWAGALAVQTSPTSNLHIVNVHNAATVLGLEFAGGLIGWAASSQVVMESCSNTGNVSTAPNSQELFMATGGLVGWMDSQNVTITDCHNKGSVRFTVEISPTKISTPHAGGIIGKTAPSTQTSMVIDSCTNSGDVTVSVESEDATIIINASANGIVSLSQMSQSNITIRNCHNNGTISVTSQSQSVSLYASGIATMCSGLTPSEMVLRVTGCTNRGTVTTSGSPTETYSAGIVSSQSMCELIMASCMNTGFVTGTNHSAGLANLAVSIENSVNIGTVNGSYSYGIARITQKVQSTVSMGDLTCSELSYATVQRSGVAQNLFFRQGILAMKNSGRAILLNNNSRWIVENYKQYSNEEDVVNTLNFIVNAENYTMWWTSYLTLGHHVTITGNNLPPSVIELGSYVIAEHGETLRNALEREGLGQFLDGTQFFIESEKHCGLNEQIVCDCSVNVKEVHVLVFVGVVNHTIRVVDGDVPTSEILKPISQFINNKAFIITLTTNNTVLFNASAPVTSDASYIIKKTAAVEVIIDDGSGLTDEEIIGAIIGEISDNDPTTVVRVVDIIREDDGSVVVRVSVEEDKAESAVVSITESDNTILRRVRRAYIVIDLSTSSSSLSFLSLLSFFLSLLFLF